MALRPLLLSLVVGIAALGASWSPAAQARGYVSVSVGTGSPYHGSGYGGGYGDGYGGGYRRGHNYHQHRPGYVLVPGHWAATYRGRIWVPAQYVRAHGPGRGHGYGYGPRPIYRDPYPRGHDPRYDGGYRGW